jgi:hypothetical protein
MFLERLNNALFFSGVSGGLSGVTLHDTTFKPWQEHLTNIF